MADVMRWYNTVNAALLDHLTNQIKETDNSGVWRYGFTHFFFCFPRKPKKLFIQILFNRYNVYFDCCYNRQLVGFKNILRSIECYGIASVHGINYFGRGLLSSDKYVDYIRHDILGKDLLNTTINYVPSVKKDYKRIAAMPGYGSLRNW